MAMLEFRTAAQRAESPDEIIDFSLADANGRDPVQTWCWSPTPDQIALYIASYQDGNLALVAATFRFVKTIFEKEDAEYLLERLNDRNDPFDLGTLTDIVSQIVAVASDRPTPPSTGSTRSPRPGGRSSMDLLPPKGQTRSRSPRPASATRSTPGASKE